MKNVSLLGVNAKKTHQYLISCFIIEIAYRLEKFKRYKDYVVYPEFDIASGENPDVSIYIENANNELPIVVVEICHTLNLSKDLEKVRNMINNNPTLIEGYVLDYETFNFYKITKTSKGKASKKAFFAHRIDAIALPIKNVFHRFYKKMSI